jgi:Ca2+-binding EF-hand superfamily protein
MKIVKYLTLSAIAAAFTSMAAFAADDAKKPEKKAADPAARFAKLDANTDGFVDADELKAGFKKKPEMADKLMKAKDKDGDSKLSKEEFTAAPKKKKQDGDKKKKKEDK